MGRVSEKGAHHLGGRIAKAATPARRPGMRGSRGVHFCCLVTAKALIDRSLGNASDALLIADCPELLTLCSSLVDNFQVFKAFEVMHPYIAVPAVAALVYRAYSRKSLTPAGIVVAALTAVVHAIHPWSVFFALLCVFFLSGTAVTKVYCTILAFLDTD